MVTDVDWSWDSVDFAFNPNVKYAQAGEILIGLGNAQNLDQPGIALNPKYSGSLFHSVSGYVFAAEAETLASWQSRLPRGLADVRRIVLEDLSLDSCLALLLFADLLDQGKLKPHAESWCSYVTRWERGYSRGDGLWSESIACLVTALGHTYLDLEEMDQAAIIDGAAFDEGARACLELLEAGFAQGTEPGSIDFGKLNQSEAFIRARSHLEHEHWQYRLALQHGQRCQLAVPLAGSGRQMIVDALFLEERNPSGLLKVFARSDRENTWTRRGFDVLGLYRPREAGMGGDMTVSVAPESGLSLRTLWEELERLEDTLWGADRPRDDPRLIVSFADLPAAPNQPWWDDYGKYTLLGAPKRVRMKDGGEALGTKLDWYQHVLPAVWRCYSPIPSAFVVSEQRQTTNGKRLCFCGWKDSVTDVRPMQILPALPSRSSAANCPTFRAWLASLSSPGEPIASPMSLPAESSYHVLDIDGGFVVVHRDGVTAFDDWTATRVAIESIAAIFRDLARAWGSLAKFHSDRSLETALNYQAALLRHGSKFDRKAFEDWKENSWAKRAEVLKVGVGVLSHADPWPLNRFRRLVCEVWGLEEQRHETLEAIDRIDKVTTEIAAHQRERRSKLLQALGAGLGLGILCKEMLETIQPLFIANPYEWQLKVFRNNLPQDQVEQLIQIAHNLHIWHFGGVLALICGLFAGVVLYLRYGAKMSEH
jgi:hypothetical protein